MNIDLEQLGIKKKEIQRLVVDAIVYQITTHTGVDDQGQEYQREQFLDDVKKEVRKEIAEQAKDVITKRLSDCVDEILTGEFQPVDSWDQKKGKPTTLRDMIKERSATFLVEKVDKDGNNTNYNGSPRMDWIISKQVNKELEYKFTTEIANEVNRAKEHLRTQVAKHITDTILKK